ncbi:hypothetical protein BV25DRAFT_1835420 [Artomyces pyxidatus]|uniref:Uncharacterized protein n=1 Tax=Artomyces pyxidatus TaxID=48021 RepID=A0ACB8TF81_9AGAM|nr:hypothetical protein BV25DRAFT_1835420 [Artomyces pyxidatus]
MIGVGADRLRPMDLTYHARHVYRSRRMDMAKIERFDLDRRAHPPWKKQTAGRQRPDRVHILALPPPNFPQDRRRQPPPFLPEVRKATTVLFYFVASRENRSDQDIPRSPLPTETHILTIPSNCPVGTWCSVLDRNPTVARRPEFLSYSPLDLPVHITIVGYLKTCSFVDDEGLPKPNVSTTFSPLLETDRQAIYKILDFYSNLPPGRKQCGYIDRHVSYRAPGADLRVDRYLPYDSSPSSASFYPFHDVFDGREGYSIDRINPAMPRIHPAELVQNDLVVYATSLERYWLPQEDGSRCWIARLKLESITLLRHESEQSLYYVQRCWCPRVLLDGVKILYLNEEVVGLDIFAADNHRSAGHMRSSRRPFVAGSNRRTVSVSDDEISSIHGSRSCRESLHLERSEKVRSSEQHSFLESCSYLSIGNRVERLLAYFGARQHRLWRVVLLLDFPAPFNNHRSLVRRDSRGNPCCYVHLSHTSPELVAFPRERCSASDDPLGSERIGTVWSEYRPQTHPDELVVRLSDARPCTFRGSRRLSPRVHTVPSHRGYDTSRHVLVRQGLKMWTDAIPRPGPPPREHLMVHNYKSRTNYEHRLDNVLIMSFTFADMAEALVDDMESYKDLEGAVLYAGLYTRLHAFSALEDTTTDIVGVARLARSAGLFLSRPRKRIPNFEWKDTNSTLDDSIVELLYRSGRTHPLRIWMVGALEVYDLDHLGLPEGYAFTSMRPIYGDSLLGANALLAHWTSKEDCEYFGLYKPTDFVNASTVCSEPLNRQPYADDELSLARWSAFPTCRLFDAKDIDDPLESRRVLSSSDFRKGDLVLQECMLKRVRSSPFTHDPTICFELRIHEKTPINTLYKVGNDRQTISDYVPLKQVSGSAAESVTTQGELWALSDRRICQRRLGVVNEPVNNMDGDAVMHHSDDTGDDSDVDSESPSLLAITPALFRLRPLSRSISAASRAANDAIGIYGLSQRPRYRWPTPPRPRSGARRTYSPANRRTDSLDLLVVTPYERTLSFTIVSRVVSTSFADRAGRPLPHVFLTFVPVYNDDALAILRILDDASRLPDEYPQDHLVPHALRADRHLPDDYHVRQNTFYPFDSVFDGRDGYSVSRSDEAMDRLPLDHLLPDDLVVCRIAIQRFWIHQDDSIARWSTGLRLESVTLLQHGSGA